MSTLQYFPEWQTAEIDIGRMIDNSFGLRMYSDYTEVCLEFMPKASIYEVPKEYREIFDAIYNEVMSYFFREIRIEDVMHKFVGEVNNQENRTRLKREIELAIEDFAARNHARIRDILKGAMGIRRFTRYVPAGLMENVERRVREVVGSEMSQGR